MIRVTAGVEAHTHEYIATAHEDQKFGFSITSGDALEAVRRVLAAPGLELRGLHSHIGSQIFDSSGFEVAARRVLALHAPGRRRSSASTMPEMDLGGGFGIAYTTQDDPADPAQLATEMSTIVEHECRALGIAQPRLSIEPGRAIVGPSMCTVYTVGTVKEVALDGGARRTYVSRRRRDERQHPHRALRRRLLLHPRRPAVRRAAGAVPGGRQALRGRRHRGQGRVPARRRAPGDLVAVPGTGAYCRSMASNYNHALRPPVIAVRDGEVAGPACGGRPRTTCWRRTWECTACER